METQISLKVLTPEQKDCTFLLCNGGFRNTHTDALISKRFRHSKGRIKSIT